MAVMHPGEASQCARCKQAGSGSRVGVAGVAIAETPLKTNAFKSSKKECTGKDRSRQANGQYSSSKVRETQHVMRRSRKLIRSILAWSAESERHKIVEYANRRWQTRVEAGLPVGTGRAPYGWSWADKEKTDALHYQSRASGGTDIHIPHVCGTRHEPAGYHTQTHGRPNPDA